MQRVMKNEAQAEYVRRIKAEMQRRSAQHTLSDFILYTSDDYLMGWVHKEICDTLDQFYEDVKARKSPRLIICMPPRSGKSQIVSRAFPAYALGRDPDLNIIATSYSSDLVSRFNRDVQRIIDNEKYYSVFPDTSLNSQNVKTSAKGSYIRTSDLFEIVGHKGSYRSTGVGGGLTGMGADILIIDDPFKDRAEADSGTIRQKVWDWYTSTAYTRLSDGGGVIVMCTRWHTDDLIGRLIRHMNDGSGDKFTVINYPAIAEHDEPHRKAGEALHPERFSLERLQSIRQTIGSRDWSALYQQKPVPEGGAVFKLDLFNKWNDKTLPPSFDNVLGSWDMTFKDTKASDYVVGQIWAQKDNSFYLLDEVRGQWDFSKTLEMFILMADKWRNVNRWLIEDKANGSAILSVLKKHINGLTPITPKESKLERAYAVQPLVESGQVYIPSSASWLASFEDEFLSFPAGAHDDQVDSFTQALNYCREHTHRKIHQANLLALQQPRFR
jgi:predicted phage terminase large subunit-like protein